MLPNTAATPAVDRTRQIDLPPVDSVALQRLIAEVRQRELAPEVDITRYNRTYHRHNR